MNYILLTKPLKPENCPDKSRVKGVVSVELSDIIAYNHEEFLNLISSFLIGDDLLIDISYSIVGHLGNTLYIEVSGDATESFGIRE